MSSASSTSDICHFSFVLSHSQQLEASPEPARLAAPRGASRGRRGCATLKSSSRRAIRCRGSSPLPRLSLPHDGEGEERSQPARAVSPAPRRAGPQPTPCCAGRSRRCSPRRSTPCPRALTSFTSSSGTVLQRFRGVSGGEASPRSQPDHADPRGWVVPGGPRRPWPRCPADAVRWWRGGSGRRAYARVRRVPRVPSR